MAMMDTQDKILELLKTEDLPEGDLTDLAEEHGIDMVKQVIRSFGGSSIYVTKVTSMTGLMNRYIKTLDEQGVRRLARELNVSVRTVQSWRRKNCGELEGQFGLFEKNSDKGTPPETDK